MFPLMLAEDAELDNMELEFTFPLMEPVITSDSEELTVEEEASEQEELVEEVSAFTLRWFKISDPFPFVPNQIPSRTSK